MRNVPFQQTSQTDIHVSCRFRALNVQAGTQFCDSEFQTEVNSGRLSSSSLNKFSCIALAGVATEYLRWVTPTCPAVRFQC